MLIKYTNCERMLLNNSNLNKNVFLILCEIKVNSYFEYWIERIEKENFSSYYGKLFTYFIII